MKMRMRERLFTTASVPRGREARGTKQLPPMLPGARATQKDPGGSLTCRQQLHGVSEGRVEGVLLGHEFGQVLVLRLHLDGGSG